MSDIEFAAWGVMAVCGIAVIAFVFNLITLGVILTATRLAAWWRKQFAEGTKP